MLRKIITPSKLPKVSLSSSSARITACTLMRQFHNSNNTHQHIKSLLSNAISSSLSSSTSRNVVHSISSALLQVNHPQTRQFSSTLKRNNIKQPSSDENKEPEEKTSFIKEVIEFLEELVMEFVSMIMWKLMYVLPILFILWFFFGTTGILAAVTVVWVFIVAIFHVDSKKKEDE